MSWKRRQQKKPINKVNNGSLGKKVTRFTKLNSIKIQNEGKFNTGLKNKPSKKEHTTNMCFHPAKHLTVAVFST